MSSAGEDTKERDESNAADEQPAYLPLCRLAAKYRPTRLA
jgi:hypothetical protein